MQTPSKAAHTSSAEEMLFLKLLKLQIKKL